MKFSFSAPSKTFLLGEYLVLKTGDALAVATVPRFSLDVEMVGAGRLTGIHPDSPAGKLVKKHADLFKNVDLKFSDPHLELGGFGASSAQFLMCYYAAWVLARKEGIDRSCAFLRKMHQAYLDIQAQEGALPPSGADVLAQATGGFCFVSLPVDGDPAGELKLQTKTWPFTGYEMLVVRTGHKLATHEHLREAIQIPVDHLKTIWNRAIRAWDEAEAQTFFAAVTDYGEVLQANGLVAASTLELLEKLKALNIFVAVRGCGAMGADVITVFFKTEDREQAMKLLRQMQLPQVASLADISEGLTVTGLEGDAVAKGLQ